MSETATHIKNRSRRGCSENQSFESIQARQQEIAEKSPVITDEKADEMMNRLSRY